MAREESNIVTDIMQSVSPMGARLVKNVRGMFWTLDKSRKVMAGLLAPGASDLIGWTTVEITPDMIGRRFAVFTAVEVKTSIGKASKEQLNFVSVVHNSGGITGVCRSPIEAKRIIDDFKNNTGQDGQFVL